VKTRWYSRGRYQATRPRSTATTPIVIPHPAALSSIVRNELPPGAFLCGSTSGATSSMETKRLENGVNYTVALAARDNFKNRGKLSDTTCNTPQLVTDFFESYREAGGKGGGGFCSIHAGPSSTLAGALAVAALALVARRRSRRGIVSKDPS
jgi:hypothetical protein